MVNVKVMETLPEEPPYEKPEVRVCRDAALIRKALPEGYLDPILAIAAASFRAQRPGWDGALHLCISFADPDAGRLYVFDSLLSNDDTDPISHRVKLGTLSNGVFAALLKPMGWTW